MYERARAERLRAFQEALNADPLIREGTKGINLTFLQKATDGSFRLFFKIADGKVEEISESEKPADWYLEASTDMWKKLITGTADVASDAFAKGSVKIHGSLDLDKSPALAGAKGINTSFTFQDPVEKTAMMLRLQGNLIEFESVKEGVEPPTEFVFEMSLRELWERVTEGKLKGIKDMISLVLRGKAKLRKGSTMRLLRYRKLAKLLKLLQPIRLFSDFAKYTPMLEIA